MDKKRLFLSQPFLSITFKTFSFPFPRKTSFIQSQNPFKERVSPDLRQKQQRHNTFGTHLSLKKTTEREREPSSSSSLFLAVLDSLHWSRYFHLALVFKAVHGYLVFCSGNKAGNLSFRGAKAVRQQPASSPESSPRREEDRWKGTCRESLNVWRGELQSFRGDIHRYRR